MARRLFQFPLAGVTDENYTQFVSSPFGWRTHPISGARSHHDGTDFIAAAGTPIYPIYDGTVRDYGYSDGYGNYVVIEHDPASFSYYCHMLHRSNYDIGEPVGKEHVIGYVGSTGRSTGPHLHFGVSGTPNFSGWVDPVKYVLDRYWDGTPEPQPLLPNQRTTAAWPVGFRAQADLDAANIAKILDPGTVIDCIWWQYGEGSDGENRFLLAKHGGLEGYVHIGDVIESGVSGIPEYAGQIAKPDPAPEPAEPEVDWLPEPIPVPRPEPIEEEPMPDVSPDKSVLDPVHSKSAMEALRNMLSPTVRVYIYVIFGVIGVALGTWQTWLVSTDQLAPWYFAGVVAVYAYLGTFIAILAAPNTKAER